MNIALTSCKNCLLLAVMFIFVACDFRLKPYDDADDAHSIEVRRYDRLESRYLTTGDFSALQQMNIDYPIETRTLVEKMLHVGEVSDPDISTRFLRFYQDSTLQALIADAEAEYANMDDINRQFRIAFDNLADMLPGLPLPKIYAQIGALDQSIVIGEQLIGISLDKYMGVDYPLYQRFYTLDQRRSMTRGYVVPDALLFYIVSLYPMDNYDHRRQIEKDLHMGKVMWIVNKAVEKRVFNTPFVKAVERYMFDKRNVDCQKFIADDDYSALEPMVR